MQRIKHTTVRVYYIPCLDFRSENGAVVTDLAQTHPDLEKQRAEQLP